MKRKIFEKKLISTVIVIIFFLSMPIMTSTYNERTPAIPLENQDTQLRIYIYGTIRLFFAPALYWGIENTGETIAHNVSGTFSVKGGFDNSINFVDIYNYGDIESKHIIGRYLLRFIDGLGFITLSVSTTSLDAGSETKSVKGFQVGFRTFILG